MYVLADLEWVENSSKRISFTQIALVRVNENWQAVSRFFMRFRPMDASFYQWEHIAFTGGSMDDFLNAPTSAHVFREAANWLLPNDTICWWFSDSMEWIQKLIPSVGNRQIILSGRVANYLGEDGYANAYRVGKRLHLDRPAPKHDSRNDVEMMRRVMEQIRFPQPVPERLPEEKPKDPLCGQNTVYCAHIETNTIHKKGCPKIPEDGQLKEYMELTKPVAKGYFPCDCVKAEFRAARKQRNQSIIDRTQYSFLFAPGSQVFHRRDCKIMLNAREIKGTALYRSCVASGRHPCKICNPIAEDERPKQVPAGTCCTQQTPAQNPARLSSAEQRAVNRHRQAQEQRKAIFRNPALSQQQRKDLFTLSQPGYAFFAAKGYQSFHLRNCRKLSGLPNMEGFPLYKDAVQAGYLPCKCCKPTEKHNAVISLPIRTARRYGESVDTLKRLCKRFGYPYAENSGLSYIETKVGIWRVDPIAAPYRLEHINRVVTPDNTTEFHRQPRLFLSLQDMFYYIKRHDEGLGANQSSK